MPRRKLPLATGETYHIFNRGVMKMPIFQDARDYRRALALLDYYQYVSPPLRFSLFLDLSKTRQEEIWRMLHTQDDRLVNVLAYCFLPNHYHLLLQQRVEEGITRFLGRWQDSLARYINTRHDRVGPLFQGVFRAVRVEDTDQLLHLSRYIHLNPWTAHLVRTSNDLRSYPWSSFGYYAGQGSNPTLFIASVLDHFPNQKAYQTFVLDYRSYQETLERVKHLIIE